MYTIYIQNIMLYGNHKNINNVYTKKNIKYLHYLQYFQNESKDKIYIT